MQSPPCTPAFVCTPILPLTHSPFFASISGTSRVLTRPLSPRVSRVSRARIVSLGAAAPPPDASSEGEENNGGEATEAVKADEVVEEVTADDILSSPSFLKAKLEILQKELIKAKEGRDGNEDKVKEEKDRYVRLVADFENYRRRSNEDLRKQDDKSTAKVCKEILGVLDNFERAEKAVEVETEKEKAIRQSYQVINKQLLEALTKLSVVPINAVGEVFDPEFHEAIQKVESVEYAEDMVCAQYQRGYRIGEALIRAAIVGVSMGPGPEITEEDGEKEVVETDEPIGETETETESEEKTEDSKQSQ